MKKLRMLVLMAIVSTCFIGASKTNAEEMPVVIDKGVSVSYKGVIYDLLFADVTAAQVCNADGSPIPDEIAPIIEVFYANSSDTIIGRFFIAPDTVGNDIEIIWIIAESPSSISAWADMNCSGDFVKQNPESKMFLPKCHLGKQSL